MSDDASRDGPKTPIVFASDASAEVARIGDTLRAAGYVVVDVPLAMLVSRVTVQKPHVVLLDADAAEALEVVARARRLPGSGAIDFVYLASGTGLVRSTEDALANEGSAFFARPVDIGALVRKIEALTGGPALGGEARSSRPPPLSRPSSAAPQSQPSRPSLPAPGARIAGSPIPMSTPSLADLIDPPRSLASFGTVSSELQQLLADAELRADIVSTPDSLVQSPEDEIEGVLPADVLASLDEPLEADEDDDAPANDAPPRAALGDREGPKQTTSGGSRVTTGGGRSHSGNTDTPASIGRKTEAREPSNPPPSVLPTQLRGPSVEPAPLVAREGAVVLGPLDARRAIADAIADRKTGALCFEHEGVARRVVLREGDLVTASSSHERESLVHFLGARGEVPRDEVERLAPKVPAYGRHAGAALVARGVLRQDQLWDVLRQHAEWLAKAVLQLAAGTLAIEPDPPGRLRSEPGVFGASTGAEIFVELVRRSIAPEEALAVLGGDASRLADGPHGRLLSECALPHAELDLLTRHRGATVGDLVSRAGDPEIASVVHALALLGVVEVVVAPDFARENANVASPNDLALDDEAIRARVRARLELVDEGDYFAVLGVSRDATSYEVRRAFVELRRTFEPSRLLSPRLAELAEDVRKIADVLDEAYEILREAPRRERYRRAIEARPDD